MEDKYKISADIPGWLAAALKDIASKNKRSLAREVEIAINRHVAATRREEAEQNKREELPDGWFT